MGRYDRTITELELSDWVLMFRVGLPPVFLRTVENSFLSPIGQSRFLRVAHIARYGPIQAIRRAPGSITPQGSGKGTV
ncbi:MAG: hypothetical protein JWP91_1800 [Fibrobacteres bacterium]|nr:hypothetical protein [Fibrobacterota bacterium]